jgi:PIN domain nuclease of toxin-antitoxin system
MKDAPLLLDTCAAIRVVEGQISQPLTDALNNAYAIGQDVFVSPISAWEIGLLMRRKRLASSLTPRRWFQSLLDLPGVQLADMPFDVLIASSFLPDADFRDPADRIVAATAREYGYILATRDRALLDYGRQGHVRFVEC